MDILNNLLLHKEPRKKVGNYPPTCLDPRPFLRNVSCWPGVLKVLARERLFIVLVSSTTLMTWNWDQGCLPRTSIASVGSNPLTAFSFLPPSLSLPSSQEVLVKHSRMQFTLQLGDIQDPGKPVLVQQNKVR